MSKPPSDGAGRNASAAAASSAVRPRNPPRSRRQRRRIHTPLRCVSWKGVSSFRSPACVPIGSPTCGWTSDYPPRTQLHDGRSMGSLPLNGIPDRGAEILGLISVNPRLTRARGTAVVAGHLTCTHLVFTESLATYQHTLIRPTRTIHIICSTRCAAERGVWLANGSPVARSVGRAGGPHLVSNPDLRRQTSHLGSVCKLPYRGKVPDVCQKSESSLARRDRAARLPVSSSAKGAS